MCLWFRMLFLTWGLLVPGALRAAGFDCAKATTRVEKMICADPRLSERDGRLAALFQENLDTSTDESLRASQRAWLKTRDACTDAACLDHVYGMRIAVLQQAAAAKANNDRRGWALRKAWRRRLKWPKTCEQAYKAHGAIGEAGENGYGVDIHKLAGKARLAVIQCDLAVYQGSFVVLWFEEGQNRPGRLLDLPDYERDASGKARPLENDGSHERVGRPDFDPVTGTLSFLDLARGIGDCGSLVTYAFKDGKAIVTAARAQYCFDDQTKWITDPRKWPLVEVP